MPRTVSLTVAGGQCRNGPHALAHRHRLPVSTRRRMPSGHLKRGNCNGCGAPAVSTIQRGVSRKAHRSVESVQQPGSGFFVVRVVVDAGVRARVPRGRHGRGHRPRPGDGAAAAAGSAIAGGLRELVAGAVPGIVLPSGSRTALPARTAGSWSALKPARRAHERLDRAIATRSASVCRPPAAAGPRTWGRYCAAGVAAGIASLRDFRSMPVERIRDGFEANLGLQRRKTRGDRTVEVEHPTSSPAAATSGTTKQLLPNRRRCGRGKAMHVLDALVCACARPRRRRPCRAGCRTQAGSPGRGDHELGAVEEAETDPVQARQRVWWTSADRLAALAMRSRFAVQQQRARLLQQLRVPFGFAAVFSSMAENMHAVRGLLQSAQTHGFYVTGTDTGIGKIAFQRAGACARSR